MKEDMMGREFERAGKLGSERTTETCVECPGADRRDLPITQGG